MPGFAIHLSVAKEVIRLIAESELDQWTDTEIEEFYIGNLLPDIKKSKKLSHFWGGIQMRYIIRMPDLDKFFSSYPVKFSNKRNLGYYCHLYVDKFYYNKFLPERVCFWDENENPTNLLRKVEYVYLYKDSKKIPYKEYWTDKYYYGDFDKLNATLQDKYEINVNKIADEMGNDEIKMNLGQRKLLQNKLRKYLNKNRAGSLTIFRENDIETFIFNAAQHFFQSLQ
ncbi:hypothetical protein AALA78_16740 [Lachnospiraceae bacterium 42-17]